MKTRSVRLPVLLVLSLLPVLFAGCATTVPAGMYRNMVSYDPPPVRERFDVNIRLSAMHTMSEEVKDMWHRTMNTDTNIQNYSQAVGDALVADFVKCGIFTRPLTSPGQAADFSLELQSKDYKASDMYKLDIAYVLRDLRAGQEAVINQRTLTMEWGKGLFDMRFKEKVPGAMNMIKESVTADLKKYFGEFRKKAQQADIDRLQQLKLVDLLVAADSSVGIARGRNRAIIAAKTLQLPELLRETKTDELTALVVKVEQVVLDLNHEAELAKDRAQQLLAAGSGGDATGSADDLRELAITYRERIELIKPIATALKEEIANRNR